MQLHVMPANLARNAVSNGSTSAASLASNGRMPSMLVFCRAMSRDSCGRGWYRRQGVLVDELGHGAAALAAESHLHQLLRLQAAVEVSAPCKRQYNSRAARLAALTGRGNTVPDVKVAWKMPCQ